MLDAFIIEEIKRREEKREDRSRHQPQLPNPTNDEDEGARRRSETEDEGPQRGVIIIDLAVRDTQLPQAPEIRPQASRIS